MSTAKQKALRVLLQWIVPIASIVIASQVFHLSPFVAQLLGLDVALIFGISLTQREIERDGKSGGVGVMGCQFCSIFLLLGYYGVLGGIFGPMTLTLSRTATLDRWSQTYGPEFHTLRQTNPPPDYRSSTREQLRTWLQSAREGVQGVQQGATWGSIIAAILCEVLLEGEATRRALEISDGLKDVSASEGLKNVERILDLALIVSNPDRNWTGRLSEDCRMEASRTFPDSNGAPQRWVEARGRRGPREK